MRIIGIVEGVIALTVSMFEINILLLPIRLRTVIEVSSTEMLIGATVHIATNTSTVMVAQTIRVYLLCKSTQRTKPRLRE